MWTIVGVVVAIDLAAVALGVLDRSVQSLIATVMFSIVTVGFATIGALIVWRHRAHSIGWLFVAVAFFFSFCHNLAQNYAVYALVVDPGSLAGGQGGVLVRLDGPRHRVRRRDAAPAPPLPRRAAAHAALAAAVGGRRDPGDGPPDCRGRGLTSRS